MALRKCSECGKERSNSATTCPHCGKKKTGLMNWAAIALVVYILFKCSAVPDAPEATIPTLTPVAATKAVETTPRPPLTQDEIVANKARTLKIAKERAAKKRNEGVSIGMVPADALASSWGKPKKVNRTTRASGVREQWVYGNGNYLYFDNGVLTSIQN